MKKLHKNFQNGKRTVESMAGLCSCRCLTHPSCSASWDLNLAYTDRNQAAADANEIAAKK